MQKRPFGVRKKHAKRAQQQTCLTAVSFIRTIPSALELHQISIRRFAGRWSRALRACQKALFCRARCLPHIRFWPACLPPVGNCTPP